ncbi:hypothetical protein SNEBB_006783, partial [Seison nebaliae]
MNNKKSGVHKFYDDSAGKKHSICKVILESGDFCGKRISQIKCAQRKSHIKHQHPELSRQLEETENCLSEEKRKDLSMKFTRAILSTASAYDVVNNQDIRIFCAAAQIKKPSVADIKSYLNNSNQLIFEKIKSILTDSSSISLTFDAWSMKNNMASFLGITFHAIHNFKLETGVLGFREFIGNHTSQNIRTILEEVVNEYGLNIGTINYFVTDGGSNVRGVFKKLCYPNEIIEEPELSLRRSSRRLFSTQKNDYSYDFSDKEDDELNDHHDEPFMDPINIEQPIREKFLGKEKNLWCVAHLAQLVVVSFTKRFNIQLSSFKKFVERLRKSSAHANIVRAKKV